jgi:hypothetical protein
MAGDALDGKHLKVTLPVAAADPAAVAATGFVYTKTVAAAPELFYEDAAGNKLQLTSGGKIPSSAMIFNGFPTGTRMPFNQTAAPTGWTKDTTAALDDTSMRIVVGAVGSGGVSAVSAGTVVFTGTTDVHTLSIAEMPVHSHVMYMYAPPSTVGGSSSGFVPGSATSTSNTGGGDGHTHALSNTAGGTVKLKYNDFIIAVKD